jgi:hypothetical protein
VSRVAARPVTDAEQHKALRVLTAIGLDDYDIDCMPDPDRPGKVLWLGSATDLQLAWFMAGDLAQALGITPTIPAHPRRVTLTDDRPARRR